VRGAAGGAPPVAGGIAFEGVSRRARDGRSLLDAVSFEVPRGALVAVVGRIGAGKSTLLRMLPRLMDPHEGRVAASGSQTSGSEARCVDLRALDLERWRARLGYVPQEASLLSATIEENVRLGRDLPAAAIARAVEDAHLQDDVARLEKGLATEVGERGITLSGGQRARVALARALAHDPDVLVLDDVSAALDAATEAQVFESLERRGHAGRTTIVATHRPATLERAARVVVIDRGAVVDQGRHQELLGRCELYREIYARARVEDGIG
jgi:ATP-binding cassette subfamily B protein